MVVPAATGGESRPRTAASQGTNATHQDDQDDDTNTRLTSELIQQHLSAIRPVIVYDKQSKDITTRYAYTALDLSGQNLSSIRGDSTTNNDTTTDTNNKSDSKSSLTNSTTTASSPLALYAQTLLSLNLSNNDLNTTQDLPEFTQLSHLSLAWNSLSSLSLPSATCKTLKLLQLDHNDFESVLPLNATTTTTEFSSLQALTLSYNHL
jgi:hypothetical protein